MEIKHYTKDRIPDVLQFERDLRSEENFWGWEIDDKYIADVTASFDNPAFANSLSLLAYVDGKVVGRIDSTKICSHFDGSTKAYLDWICVIKSFKGRLFPVFLIDGYHVVMGHQNGRLFVNLAGPAEEQRTAGQFPEGAGPEYMGVKARELVNELPEFAIVFQGGVVVGDGLTPDQFRQGGNDFFLIYGNSFLGASGLVLGDKLQSADQNQGQEDENNKRNDHTNHSEDSFLRQYF